MVEYAKSTFAKQQEAEEAEYSDVDHISLSYKTKQKWIVRQENGTLGHISIDGSIVRVRTRLRGIVYSKESVEMDGSYDGEGSVIVNPSISQEQAQIELNEFLLENELEGYVIDEVTAARYFAILTREEISQGWRFKLIRTYGYYPLDTFAMANDGGYIRISDAESYSPAWESESMYVYISENGVEYFQWNSPLEIVECANPSVELLAFEEIQEKMKRLLTVGISWMDFSAFQPKISKLVLTVAPQRVKDEPGYAYLMPIWVAVVDWYYLNEETPSTEVVGINAIDSSRAELNWG